MNAIQKRHQDFHVRAYEVDQQENVRLAALCNYLQESAGNHADALGVGYKEMISANLFWALSYLSVSVHRYGKRKDTLRIETWPVGFHRFYAMRDFAILDAQYKPIGYAQSTWLVVDLKSRKPVRVPAFIIDLLNAKPVPVYQMKNFDLFRPEGESEFRVRKSDLDLNNHVNHVRFIEWAIESVPAVQVSGLMVAQIEISFRSEGLLDDRIIVRSQRSPESEQTEFYHKGYHKENNTELFRAKSVWKSE